MKWAGMKNEYTESKSKYKLNIYRKYFYIPTCHMQIVMPSFGNLQYSAGTVTGILVILRKTTKISVTVPALCIREHTRITIKKGKSSLRKNLALKKYLFKKSNGYNTGRASNPSNIVTF